jgi:transposase
MGRKRIPRKKPKTAIREVKLDELKAIVERAKTSLSEEDSEKLEAAVDTLAFLTSELEKKGVSINRLRKLLFGASTEKTSQIFKDTDENSDSKADGESSASSDGGSSETGSQKKNKKRKGHGRNGASEYKGAEKIKIPHEALKSGDTCPGCEKGKVYVQNEPAVIVRVRGMAPLSATVYERERLRCNLCGEVFTAALPEGVGKERYDETVASMIGMLKYGAGLPFNRIERLERGMGIPLPAATQWEIVERAAGKFVPVHDELIYQAAQGDVLHNDDTTMKILELCGQSQKEAMKDKNSKERTGVFTSGVVSVSTGHKVALFFTGRNHAGENLEKVLKKRAEELGPPIQMCDLLSRNTAGDFETIVAGCMAHSRRKYVDVANNFPEQVRHVLEELKIVYKNDADAKKEEMSPDERLVFHQEKSGPVMERLEKWLQQQFDEKKVEPNSSLGEAIDFMQRHWDKLTLFLHVPGAPIDNNIVERSLKKAILHRKNSYFYKTENGARVGDMFMALIHSAEINEVDPYPYLVALLRHHKEVDENPSEWMPWNYKETMARLGLDPDLPP